MGSSIGLGRGPSIGFTFPVVITINFRVLFAIRVGHVIGGSFMRGLHINFAPDQIEYFLVGFF